MQPIRVPRLTYDAAFRAGVALLDVNDFVRLERPRRSEAERARLAPEHDLILMNVVMSSQGAFVAERFLAKIALQPLLVEMAFLVPPQGVRVGYEFAADTTRSRSVDLFHVRGQQTLRGELDVALLANMYNVLELVLIASRFREESPIAMFALVQISAMRFEHMLLYDGLVVEFEQTVMAGTFVRTPIMSFEVFAQGESSGKGFATFWTVVRVDDRVLVARLFFGGIFLFESLCRMASVLVMFFEQRVVHEFDLAAHASEAFVFKEKLSVAEYDAAGFAHFAIASQHVFLDRRGFLDFHYAIGVGDVVAPYIFVVLPDNVGPDVEILLDNFERLFGFFVLVFDFIQLDGGC